MCISKYILHSMSFVFLDFLSIDFKSFIFKKGLFLVFVALNYGLSESMRAQLLHNSHLNIILASFSKTGLSDIKVECLRQLSYFLELFLCIQR